MTREGGRLAEKVGWRDIVRLHAACRGPWRASRRRCGQGWRRSTPAKTTVRAGNRAGGQEREADRAAGRRAGECVAEGDAGVGQTALGRRAPARLTADPNPLITLFRRCVVRIHDGEGPVPRERLLRGAGPGRDLRACGARRPALQAVVAGPGRCGEPSPARCRRWSTVVDPAAYPLPDLALLGLGDAAPDGIIPVCACRRAAGAGSGHRTVLYLAGYTIEHGPVPRR